MLVVGLISLALFNQILVYEVWPKTLKMLLCSQGLKVEILQLQKLNTTLAALATFRNHHRSHIKEIHCASEESLENKIMEAITFVELVIFINSSVEEINFFFKLPELRHFYESHLKYFWHLQKNQQGSFQGTTSLAFLNPKLRATVRTFCWCSRKECSNS